MSYYLAHGRFMRVATVLFTFKFSDSEDYVGTHQDIRTRFMFNIKYRTSLNKIADAHLTSCTLTMAESLPNLLIVIVILRHLHSN